jgi:2,5-diamino-6-(ribosylamino)-4(3H)-pyrimidinone 5'-phosphate reductase
LDIRSVLEYLNRNYGVRTIRADCGGTLNSVLLQAGVVSELSVLIHPFPAGWQSDPTLFDPLESGIPDLQTQ